MRKVQYNRANGSVITVDDVFAASQRANEAKGVSVETGSSETGSSGGIWPSIIDNVGGWLNSIGQTITGSFAAKNPVTMQDNTPRVLAIAGVGVAAVVLIIALLVIFKK